MSSRLVNKVLRLCWMALSLQVLLSCGMCDNEIRQEVFSPDRKHKAVAFVRDCGATTAFSTQISIINADEKLENAAGNILVASNDFEITITWIDNQRVQILVPDTESRISQKETSLNGISIIYDVLPAIAETKNIIPYILSFPIDKLDNVFTPISKIQWSDLLKNKKSNQWKINVNDSINSILRLHEENYTDVTFQLFTPDSESTYSIAVLQKSRNESDLSFWRFKDTTWSKMPSPLPSIDSYTDTASYSNSDLRSLDMNDYLDFEFHKDTILTRLNSERWSIMLLDELNLPDDYVLDSRDFVAFINVIVWQNERLEVLKVDDRWHRSESEISSHLVVSRADQPEPLSFACPETIHVKASSELSTQGSNTFKAENLIDSSLATAWVEGVLDEDDYLEESISFTINKNGPTGSNWFMVNGYAKNISTWRNNNRVKRLRCFVNGEGVAQITLLDTEQLQSFSIFPWWKDTHLFKIGDVIRFEILEIYQGEKYKTDTAISLFMPEGNCE